MPLPRFDRLSADSRAAILTVARKHFARDGFEAASYNKIIAEAGISKTSAYHYFDGKADLHGAVLAELATRVANVLGEWVPAPDAASFWGRLAESSSALLQHLDECPEDRALLSAGGSSATPARSEPSPWVRAVVADAARLGLVEPAELELMTAATEAVLGAVDRHVLAHPDRAAEVAADVPRLLARLWGAPT
jgi:AcrR family transcriptional regulator